MREQKEGKTETEREIDGIESLNGFIQRYILDKYVMAYKCLNIWVNESEQNDTKRKRLKRKVKANEIIKNVQNTNELYG